MKKLTRRQALAAGPAALTALAQGQTPTTPGTQAENRQAAAEAVQKAHDQLSAIELNTEVEPAFVFRA